VTKLSDILADCKDSGVYLLEGTTAVSQAKELVERHGLAFLVLDGKTIHGKDEFLKQAAATLQFPDYFGGNWDALADCLTDMSWHQASGFVILYNDFNPFAEKARDEFRVALDIFRESTEFWRSQGKIMIVLLAGTPENAKEAPAVSL
jgi:RNAse (barnase) inhibitor barstar